MPRDGADAIRNVAGTRSPSGSVSLNRTSTMTAPPRSTEAASLRRTGAELSGGKTVRVVVDEPPAGRGGAAPGTAGGVVVAAVVGTPVVGTAVVGTAVVAVVVVPIGPGPQARIGVVTVV